MSLRRCERDCLATQRARICASVSPHSFAALLLTRSIANARLLDAMRDAILDAPTVTALPFTTTIPRLPPAPPPPPSHECPANAAPAVAGRCRTFVGRSLFAYPT